MGGERISCFVVAYNRAKLLRACLIRARFAEELIVIDKSSTDETPAVAKEFADKYERVPWSAIAEDNRHYAESLCSHEWIVFLDDDEVLSPDAGRYLRAAVASDAADVYSFPIRHHFFGRWEEHFQPEWRPILYRKGALDHSRKVHTPPKVFGRHIASVGGQVYIQNLSHENTASIIEKLNRYTTRTVEERGADLPPLRGDLIEFARDVVETRIRQYGAICSSEFFQAVLLIYMINDLITGLKAWEVGQPDGHALFDEICRKVEAEYRQS